MELSRGNPLLLELLILIYQYGGMELIQKVEILPMNEMKSDI